MEIDNTLKCGALYQNSILLSLPDIKKGVNWKRNSCKEINVFMCHFCGHRIKETLKCNIIVYRSVVIIMKYKNKENNKSSYDIETNESAVRCK